MKTIIEWSVTIIIGSQTNCAISQWRQRQWDSCFIWESKMSKSRFIWIIVWSNFIKGEDSTAIYCDRHNNDPILWTYISIYITRKENIDVSFRHVSRFLLFIYHCFHSCRLVVVYLFPNFSYFQSYLYL